MTWRGNENGNGRAHAGGRSLALQLPGFRGRIVGFEANGANGTTDTAPVPRRLRELGFVPGTPVAVLRKGPLGDPIELELRGYRICLRRNDLASVQVESDPT